MGIDLITIKISSHSKDYIIYMICFRLIWSLDLRKGTMLSD
jgi:hypothetical protein